MEWPKFVCPNERSLLETFQGQTFAVRIRSLDEARCAEANVRECGNTLFCAILESVIPLEAIEFSEDQKDIPLALFVTSIGKVRKFAKRLDLMRQSNMRVYVPANNQENLAGIRILSSLGIHTCAVIDGTGTNWEALIDLMTYAVLGRVPHASIQPFDFIASHYHPEAWTNWGRVYFDDVAEFLHLDAQGRVGLCHKDLMEGRFVAGSVGEIGDPSKFPAIKDRVQSWKRYFLENHPCASCPGWKICLGRLSAHPPDGCAEFAQEMIQVARQSKSLQTAPEGPSVWQL